MNFVVLYRGCGYGCDYTIGCNKKWSFIEADSIKEATEKVLGASSVESLKEKYKQIHDDCEGDEGYISDRMVDEFDFTRYREKYDSIELIEISNTYDLGPIADELQGALLEIKEEAAEKEAENAELEEYKRLKIKFGDK